MLRARALEQALRMLRNECHAIMAMSYDAIKDSAGYTNLKVWIGRVAEADALLAVDPPPSGASPQATGGYIHHSITDWIPTPECDCDRCTSARKSAPKPTGGASPQAETSEPSVMGAGSYRRVQRDEEFIRFALSSAVNTLEEAGCACQPEEPCALCLCKEAVIHMLESNPAPVSPVEPEPPICSDPHLLKRGCECASCLDPVRLKRQLLEVWEKHRAFVDAVASALHVESERGPVSEVSVIEAARDTLNQLLDSPTVEPEPPTTCRCLDCEPLTDPGPKPSEDDINRLEKAAWDSKTDLVLVWYRDRAEMFRQRLRETERAWQLDRKKPTVEPEPPTEAQFGEYDRLKRQAREIEKALREAGCPAMPLEQGVRWLADKDFTAPLPPRPPAVVKPHRYDLVRYGVTWEGQDNQPLLTPMPDGYWTPWHLAVEAPTVEPEPCVCLHPTWTDRPYPETGKIVRTCNHCGAPLKVER